MINKMVRHFLLVMRHKAKVFKLCCKAGIPLRGLLHDLSKFSPTEFFESVKYYTGNKSPIMACREENGYSKAWLHHKGRNKHHFEYWYDEKIPGKMPVIPYKYMAEMICDNLAAGMTYRGKEWTQDYQLQYWNRAKLGVTINPVVANILTEVFTKIAEDGIDKVINKKTLQNIYNRNLPQ